MDRLQTSLKTRCLLSGWRLAIATAALLVLSGANLVLADGEAQKLVLQQVSAIRGLAVMADVPLEFVSAEKVRSDILTADQTPESEAELEVSRKTLVLLGLIPADMNVRQTLADLYGDALAGYYSNKEKKMFIVGQPDQFTAATRLTLAHEFTHALQDQHFDLLKVKESVSGHNDKTMAVASLIEGDAVVTQVLYVQRHFTAADRQSLNSAPGSDRPNPFDKVPIVYRDSIIFPYREGVDFAVALYRDGGMARIDLAWRDPPTSTEQVIHPERYFQRDEPVVVELPDLAGALGEGWAQLDVDTFGELDFRNILLTFSDSVAANAGSAGWGGDRYAYLEGPNGVQALVSVSAWDDEKEAREFFGLYAATVSRRFGPKATLEMDQPDLKIWTTPAGVHSLRNAGNRIHLLYAPDVASLERINRALGVGELVPV